MASPPREPREGGNASKEVAVLPPSTWNEGLICEQRGAGAEGFHVEIKGVQ